MRTTPVRSRSGRASLLAAVCALALPQSSVLGQRPFTPEDALNVRTLSIQDVTPEGRWVAATIRTHRDGLGVDHFRFGDPTYVAPSFEEFVVIDSDDGSERAVLDGRVQIGQVAWSPDGATLAFVEYDANGHRIRLYRPADGGVRDLEIEGDRPLASNTTLAWRPDGSGLLVQLRETAWAERARAAFLERTEGPIVVHDGSEPFLDWDRVRNMGGLTVPAMVALDGAVEVLLPEGVWGGFQQSEDGRWLSVLGERPLETVYEGTDGSEWRLLRVDLESGDTTHLIAPSTDRPRPDWSPDGTRYVTADEGDLHLRAIEEDSSRILTEGMREAVSAEDTTRLRFSAMRWRPDGGALLVGSQRGWHLLDLASGEMELVHALTDEDRDEGTRLSVQAWTPDGGALLVATSERDRWERGLARFDLASGTLETLVADADLYRGWTLSDDGRRLFWLQSDGDRPDELHVAGPALDSPRRLTTLNPWLDEVALTRSELVEYLDVDGERLYGILYYPVDYRSGTAYPLVVEVYEDFFDNGFNHRMNLVASQEWFGFRPSVDLEVGFPGEAWLKGVTTGVNALIERGLVDGDRVGIHGTSYGGYAVNLLVTQTNRFAAAINISGKVNIISFLGDSEKITTRNYRAAEAGQDRIGATLWEQPQKYLAHSAILYADRIETPLLLLTGEGDWNVPATNQREMYYALRRLGKKVVWVNYMLAGHGAGRSGRVPDFHDHWARIVDWYRTHFDEAASDDIADGSGGGLQPS